MQAMNNEKNSGQTALACQDVTGLRNPLSLKWSSAADDALALWIADMDFSIADDIKAAMKARLDQTLGYTDLLSEEQPLRRLLAEQFARQGAPDVRPAGMRLLPAVVQGLYAAVAAFSEAGDEVLALTPTYPPFHQAVQLQGRVWKGVQLQMTETNWEIDWTALEAAISPKTRLMMLCHPHNPSGRIWTKEELSRLVAIATAHDMIICCDELHAELCWDREFFSILSLPEAKERTVVLTGTGKTNNLAALGGGAMVAVNLELLDRVQTRLSGLLGNIPAFSAAAWEAALTHGEDWRSAVREQLLKNRQIVSEWAAAHPQVRYLQPEATYLAWLNCGGRSDKTHCMNESLLKNGVMLNDGQTFFAPEDAAAGYCTVRLNFATSEEILREALGRIERSL